MTNKKTEKSLIESVLDGGPAPIEVSGRADVFQAEIDCISDSRIRSFVRAILNTVDAFWYSPSSFSEGIHPPDELGPEGLVLHTKRTFRAVAFIVASLQLSPAELDCILAATLLHDVTKAYWIDEEQKIIGHDPMHPYTVDALVKMKILEDQDKNVNPPNPNTLEIEPNDLDFILKLIRFSHGMFSIIPETVPSNELENIVHTADMFATHLHVIIDGTEVNKERWI